MVYVRAWRSPLIHTAIYIYIYILPEPLALSPLWILRIRFVICAMSNRIGTEHTVWYSCVCFDFCLGKHFKQYRLISLFVRSYQKLELDIIRIPMLVLFSPLVCPFFHHFYSHLPTSLLPFFSLCLSVSQSVVPSLSYSAVSSLLLSLFWFRLHSIYLAKNLSIPTAGRSWMLVDVVAIFRWYFWCCV